MNLGVRRTESDKMATLRIPTPLRTYTGGLTDVELGGQSIGEVMTSLVERYPQLKPHLYNGDGKLRPFVNLFVGENNVKDLQGLETPVSQDSRILLVPSIAGG
jgi:molybdopterin synthase sulfur carrier subunit